MSILLNEKTNERSEHIRATTLINQLKNTAYGHKSMAKKREGKPHYCPIVCFK